MFRNFGAIVILAALATTAACRGKGPTPKSDPAAGSSTSERPGSIAPATNPHQTGEIPIDTIHQRGGSPTNPPPPGGTVDLGAITITPDENWSFESPKSSMRRAQFSIPGEGGAAELVVYFFGAGGAGSTEANTDRWIAQFTNTDGSAVSNAKREDAKIAGFEMTRVDVSGSYVGGMGPGAQPQKETPNQRLLAAIVQTPGGPYYFKLLGPDATVSENESAFDALLKSIILSP